ncbi:hypothetical protein Rhopal_007378-T1 [Rhodotorula paludigena]|uniref:Uncharacterized protein n=1 Tax=Rhodotorula paludigena TaxID=86838 RepID=A0AAV5GWH1_9BASI|nr:hypothetical protein Rhopal_007378-T1 [Rhodotorula paludigena]
MSTGCSTAYTADSRRFESTQAHSSVSLGNGGSRRKRAVAVLGCLTFAVNAYLLYPPLPFPIPFVTFGLVLSSLGAVKALMLEGPRNEASERHAPAILALITVFPIGFFRMVGALPPNALSTEQLQTMYTVLLGITVFAAGAIAMCSRNEASTPAAAADNSLIADEGATTSEEVHRIEDTNDATGPSLGSWLSFGSQKNPQAVVRPTNAALK